MHKETFWHILTHFIGHYFHYDSKFWVTLKTLCFYPGKLTLAYHNHQRMKYIPPVNLYIFVSVVFFLFFSKSFDIRTTYGENTQRFIIHYEAGRQVHHTHEPKIFEYLKYDGDSIRSAAKDMVDAKRSFDSLFNAKPVSFTSDYLIYVAGNKFLADYAYEHGILSMPDLMNEIAEKFLHILPKVFFVLMPLFALLLYFVFFGKVDYYFVDHGIMSLHIHTVLFISLMVFLLLSYIYIPDLVYMALFFGFILPGIYFLRACVEFYKRSWLYVLVFGSIAWCVYFLMVFAVTIASLFFVTIYF